MMQPGGTDPEDFPRMVQYRRAFGLAADLADQAGADLVGLGMAWSGVTFPPRSAPRGRGVFSRQIVLATMKGTS